jgi:hypothetical protein
LVWHTVSIEDWQLAFRFVNVPRGT